MTMHRVVVALCARYWLPMIIIAVLLIAPWYLAYLAWALNACGPFFMPRT